MRRPRGERDSERRCLITKDVLLRVLPLSDQSTMEGMATHKAFCRAFAKFLRADEFTHSVHDWEEDEEFSKRFLTRRSVRLHDDHLESTRAVSKIDFQD